MVKSKKKRLQERERRTDARNVRTNAFYYMPIDETKDLAVPAGRCYRCNKITPSSCDLCNKYFCGKHLKEGICGSCEKNPPKKQTYFG